ncbi:MAG: hypothetical protein WDA00_04930 [Eubacteriales bacterium]
MSKKVVIVVVLVECVFAVLLVSLLGLMVESINPREVVTELYFTDENGTRYAEGISVEVDLSASLDVQLYWRLLSETATNQEVSFVSDVIDGSVVVSDTGVVTFYKIKPVAVTVRAMDGSGITATLILAPKTGTDPNPID